MSDSLQITINHQYLVSSKNAPSLSTPQIHAYSSILFPQFILDCVLQLSCEAEGCDQIARYFPSQVCHDMVATVRYLSSYRGILSPKRIHAENIFVHFLLIKWDFACWGRVLLAGKVISGLQRCRIPGYCNEQRMYCTLSPSKHLYE